MLVSTISLCHRCGGNGLPGGCPKCGKQQSDLPRLAEEDFSLLPTDLIPTYYQGSFWKSEANPSTGQAKDYNAKLEKVLNLFLSRKIPKFSMFIGSTAKSGKHLFAYSCLQTSLSQGFSIAPLFSTSDWIRLYKTSQINPLYKLYKKYTWDDLIVRDVLFISVDHTNDRFNALPLFKDIFDVRASFNLPTFVISDYELTELNTQWGKDDYQIIYNTEGNRNFLRYPVIVQNFKD